MERAIHGVRQCMIGRDRKEDVGRFDRDLVLVEVVILENADMVEGTFDQSFGTGLAILFEKVLLEASGIDTDADRAAVRTRGGDDFLDAIL
jgi:hypothetical protein